MTIFKYPLESIDAQVIKMPKGAKILTVQTQSEIPCLWAMVEPNAPQERRYIEIFGTGHQMPENGREYIGTFQLHNGRLVLHVFEVNLS